MNRRARDDDLADLDRLIEEIVVDAYDDNEQLWAFCQAFEVEVPMPADAFVIGEPVSVVAPVSCRSATILTVYCPGAWSTTALFCAACTAMAYASGALAATPKPSSSSTACSGSTLRTTRGCAFSSKTSNTGGPGKNSKVRGEPAPALGHPRQRVEQR